MTCWKTKAELKRMEASGRALAAIMAELVAIVKPGVKTGDLNEAAIAHMDRLKVKPSFLGYAPWGKTPYPAVLCVSVESEVIHGIPGRCLSKSGRPVPDRELYEGEIVSLDCGVQLDGFHADMATTVPVGSASPEKTSLIAACRAALEAGIQAVRPHGSLRDVVAAIQAAAKGYGIVEGYGGHGIGRSLHEAPFVPNVLAVDFDDVPLKPGLVLALEPMLNLKSEVVVEADDGWTVLAEDGSPSAHFEHTVAVTKKSFQVLTSL